MKEPLNIRDLLKQAEEQGKDQTITYLIYLKAYEAHKEKSPKTQELTPTEYKTITQQRRQYQLQITQQYILGKSLKEIYQELYPNENE